MPCQIMWLIETISKLLNSKILKKSPTGLLKNYFRLLILVGGSHIESVEQKFYKEDTMSHIFILIQVYCYNVGDENNHIVQKTSKVGTLISQLKLPIATKY